MFKKLFVSIPVLLAVGVALGQGKKAQELRTKCSASPAYITNDFFKTLGKNLGDALGEKRGGKMISALADADLEPKEVVKVMNGDCTKNQLQDWFGAKRIELDRTRKALDKTVAEKNRNCFFGIMLDVMIGDFGVDPSAEFAQQACGTHGEISEELFEKLLKGNRSTRTMKEAFGFENKQDQGFMQKIVNRMWEVPGTNHPLCESLGMGSADKFKADDFPTMSEGMAGYGEFEDGVAAGMKCDTKLPPTPYFGRDVKKHFGDKD